MNLKFSQVLTVFEKVLLYAFSFAIIPLTFLVGINLFTIIIFFFFTPEMNNNPEAPAPDWTEPSTSKYAIALYVLVVCMGIAFLILQALARKDPKHHKLAMQHLLSSTDLLNPNSYIRNEVPAKGTIQAYPFQLDLDKRTITIPRGLFNLRKRKVAWENVDRIEFGISKRAESTLTIEYKRKAKGRQSKCKRRLVAIDYIQILPLFVAYFGDQFTLANHAVVKE